MIARFLLLSILCLGLANARGQVILFEDFTNYSKVKNLCEQSEHWRTWSGEEGGWEDAPVTFRYPDTNSVVQIKNYFGLNPGDQTDVLLNLGDLREGVYNASFDIYIPAEKGAYYNFQHFEIPGIEWAFSLTVESGGISTGLTYGTLEIGGRNFGFSIHRGQWVRLEHIVDLDNDMISLLIDSRYAHSWQFSRQTTSRTGTNQLGAINFYPLDGWNEYYIDNVKLERLSEEVPASGFFNGDFEEGTVGRKELPLAWRHIPQNDVNSLSSESLDSLPYLLSSTANDPEPGLSANAMSGSNFVAGALSQDDAGNVTHTGISQMLRGLEVGMVYAVSFHQAVIKSARNRDPAGRWQVILNDSVIGLSELCRNEKDYLDQNVEWEFQEISFMATSADGRIKFLPLDDDDNILLEEREGILMGIDRVAIQPVLTSTEAVKLGTATELYPNPAGDVLYLETTGGTRFHEVRIYDMAGRLVRSASVSPRYERYEIDISGLPRGLYALKTGDSTALPRFFVKN